MLGKITVPSLKEVNIGGLVNISCMNSFLLKKKCNSITIEMPHGIYRIDEERSSLTVRHPQNIYPFFYHSKKLAIDSNILIIYGDNVPDKNHITKAIRSNGNKNTCIEKNYILIATRNRELEITRTKYEIPLCLAFKISF